MDKFQSVYQEAANELPELKMDAERVRDELHHKKMRRQRQRKLAVKGCAAAASFLLVFNVGAVTARNYYDSVINVGGEGYSVTSAGKADNSGNVEKSRMGGALNALAFRDGLSEAEVFLEEEIIEPVEYNSVREFLAKEEQVIAMPELSVMKADFQEEYVAVTKDEIYVSLRGEECYFHMRQYAHLNCRSYASATSYGGRSVNERSFTNRQGLNYVMFDTVDESGKLVSTHAVISVNGRDLALDFQGFEEDVIQEVLNSMDLTVYFCEKR